VQTHKHTNNQTSWFQQSMSRHTMIRHEKFRHEFSLSIHDALDAPVHSDHVITMQPVSLTDFEVYLWLLSSSIRIVFSIWSADQQSFERIPSVASSSIIASLLFKLSSVVLVSESDPFSTRFSVIAHPFTLISLSMLPLSASSSASAVVRCQYSKTPSSAQIHPCFFVSVIILSVFIFLIRWCHWYPACARIGALIVKKVSTCRHVFSSVPFCVGLGTNSACCVFSHQLTERLSSRQVISPRISSLFF
jgi:hypothetical protein